MYKLRSKVALITGGASGLGKSIAQRLTAEGAIVVVTDIQRGVSESAASEGHFALFLEQDVSDEIRWMQVMEEIERRYGRLDVLVNNAGILGPTDAMSPEDTRLADWKRIFAVNVDDVFLGCRAAIQAMRKTRGGSIVNVCSIAALMASAHATAYGASKATVQQLTKSVAQYCTRERLAIRCNSVHPGIVRTPLWERSARESARKRGVRIEEIVAETAASIPMGDFTLPEDIAASVAFLVSDDARHITGAKLIVDGGYVSCKMNRLSLK